MEKRFSSVEEAGAAALRRLKSNQTFEDWVAVGRVLMLYLAEAMAACGCQDPDDYRVVREASRRFRAWEARVSNEPPLTRQERWSLRELMTHPEITTWYLALPGPTRRRLNHPNAIINRWKNLSRTRLVPATEEDAFEALFNVVRKTMKEMDRERRRKYVELLKADFEEEMKIVDVVKEDE
jgi:hypothetical protein